MANGDKHIDPQSMRRYETDAEAVFDAIRSQLESLVAEVVEVKYYGKNASEFKTKCGHLAADFASALTQDLQSISQAVEASTSALLQSLGEPRITIQVKGGTISPPAIPGSTGEAGANVPALNGLRDSVKTRFTSINDQLDVHLEKLRATSWIGDAKDDAVDAVTHFTNSAKSKVDENSSKLMNYIQAQVDAISNL